MRPHSYLIHRRIALAKKMLSVPGTAIVDIALSVGFQTQAHFTTVFKRTEGVTPCKWRRGRAQVRHGSCRRGGSHPVVQFRKGGA